MHMARDMTKGNITGHLIAYAVPLVFGNLFQQLYHTVDSVVVGQFYGKEALAAVGAAGPIMNILTFLIVGLSIGASVLMASYFGAKEYQNLKDEFATSVLSGLALTIVLSVIALSGSHLFICLTQTPAEISAQASLYLQIISFGLIFTFFYNIFSAALRSIGDSRAPLYVLILTTIVNVFLDVFLVGYCHLGVSGAAIATILSQGVSALALFIYIWAKVPMLRLGIRDLRVKTSMLKRTIDFSSISAIQQTILYVGRLLVQSGVNALGVDAVAAFNAVSIIDSYVLAPGDSLAASITTYSAQNLGAKEYERIPQGLRKILVIAEIYIILTAVAVLLCRHPLLGIFLKPNEIEALRQGMSYLIPMAVFYFLSGITNSFQGYYRGIGHLKITLFATLVQIPVRVAISYALFGRIGIQAVAIGTAIGWMCMIVFEVSMYRKYGHVKALKKNVQ